jgi:hypothetical protein
MTYLGKLGRLEQSLDWRMCHGLRLKWGAFREGVRLPRRCDGHPALLFDGNHMRRG